MTTIDGQGAGIPRDEGERIARLKLEMMDGANLDELLVMPEDLDQQRAIITSAFARGAVAAIKRWDMASRHYAEDTIRAARANP